MLCLRAEVLDDDRHSCAHGDAPAGGFSLPINFGSSIHRYLRKAGSGGVKGSRQWTWSGAFSSADDGSPNSSDFEDTKPPGRSREEKGEKMCLQRYQLEKDVKELQKKLQEEIDLHLALASAVEHSGSPFSTSPNQLPDKAQELLDSISVLEITVSKLEEELIALECQLSQERNERRLTEYHLRHLPCPTSSHYDCSPSYLPEPIMRFCSGERMEETILTDDTSPSTAIPEHLDKVHIVENLWHHPNQLSEEMILCMRDIFLILADSSKFSSVEGSSALSSSPQGHSHSSLADSPGAASLMRSTSVDLEHGFEVPSQDRLFDPYRVPGKVDWRTSIGSYSKAVEVSWLSVGKKELEYAAGAFKRFRLLVEQLARVNPSCMSCNEKLAFWVNLYNALIMHAYLAYGVPKSDTKLLSLMQKVAYVVGGHSFSAIDIECTVLKMKPPSHCPQLGLVLALHKFKVSEELKKYSIDHPEPLLAFALSCGMYSSPAVRIFRPGNVNELLMKSMKDYIRASVGIGERGKLLVPKLLHSFAKGNVEETLLPEWICQFLSPEQAAVVKDCSSSHKWRLLGPRSFTVVPFDSRFRYLFLPEENRRRHAACDG